LRHGSPPPSSSCLERTDIASNLRDVLLRACDVPLSDSGLDREPIDLFSLSAS